MSLLSIEGLDFAYGEVQVLRDVRLELPTGCLVCLMGRNGVGKTSLVGNVTGLLQPRRGEIRLEGVPITALPAHRRVRAGLALVPQGRQIFPRLTVQENLEVGLAPLGRGARVPDEVYDYFPALTALRRRRGGDLSGGQQQQLAIARALVTRPRLLVLDEPTEGIQPNIIQLIGALLRRLIDERGLTVLMVEQYVDFVREHGDVFHVMNRGAVVASGPVGELHDDLVHRYLSV